MVLATLNSFHPGSWHQKHAFQPLYFVPHSMNVRETIRHLLRLSRRQVQRAGRILSPALTTCL